MKTFRCVDHYGMWHDIPGDKFIFRASAYGILVEKDQILLVKERWGKLWELPGGGVKSHELLLDALKREFTEETGIEIENIKLYTVLEDFIYAEDRDEAWHSIRLIYQVKKIAGSLRTSGNKDDIIAAEFLPLTNLHQRKDLKSFMPELLKNLCSRFI